MAAFVSWRELLEQMRHDLASGAWRTMSGYTVAGRTINYRSFAEFRAMFDFVADEAAKEDGQTGYRGRMYAAQGRRQGGGR